MKIDTASSETDQAMKPLEEKLKYLINAHIEQMGKFGEDTTLFDRDPELLDVILRVIIDSEVQPMNAIQAVRFAYMDSQAYKPRSPDPEKQHDEDIIAGLKKGIFIGNILERLLVLAQKGGLKIPQHEVIVINNSTTIDKTAADLRERAKMVILKQ